MTEYKFKISHIMLGPWKYYFSSVVPEYAIVFCPDYLLPHKSYLLCHSANSFRLLPSPYNICLSKQMIGDIGYYLKVAKILFVFYWRTVRTTRLLKINTSNIEQRLRNTFKLEMKIGGKAKIIEIGRKDADQEHNIVISHLGKLIPYQFFSCRRGLTATTSVNIFVKP